MSLLTTHTNWMTGSYATDLQYLLKVAENNPLKLNPAQTNIEPQIDSVNSLVIGYGYDLVQNDPAAAVAALTAAGATITNAALLQQKLAALTVPVTQTQRAEIAALLKLPNEAVATALLQNEISAREDSFTDFIKAVNGGTDIPPSKERAALMSMWYQSPGGYFGSKTSPSNLTKALISGNRAEAWYQIRYKSAANGTQGDGVVSRRFVDAQMFGLYEDRVPTADDAHNMWQVVQGGKTFLYTLVNPTYVTADGVTSYVGTLWIQQQGASEQITEQWRLAA